MKKMIGIAVAFAVVVDVLRRFGPGLRDRAMAKCQESRSTQERAHDKEPASLVPATAG